MSAFQFRLQPLLQQRRGLRDAAGGDVAKAQAAIDRVEHQLAELQAQYQAARQHTHDAAHAHEVSVDALLQRGRYELQLTAQIHGLRQTLDQLGTELTRRRGVLTDCQMEVKRLEKLRDRSETEHRATIERQNQRQLDDVVTAQVAMRRLAARRDSEVNRR